MPSVPAVSRSIVLTHEGWLPLSGEQLPDEIFGLDRRGKLKSMMVEYSAGGDARCAFIATESVHGFFAPDSRLMNSDGETIAVEHIVEDNRVAELSVESLLEFPRQATVGANAAEAAWNSIAGAAAYTGSSACMIKCRGQREEIGSSCNNMLGVSLRKCGKRPFTLVDRERFAGGFRTDWQSTVVLLSDMWLKNDEGFLEIQRTESLIGIWVLSALHARQIGYRIVCDSLQHTSILLVELVSGLTSALGRGRTGCYTVDRASQLEIRWDDSSWSPIINGFVLPSV